MRLRLFHREWQQLEASYAKKPRYLDAYNSKLAHHTRVEGSLKYYPKEGGVGHIIDSLMEKLDTEGVDISTIYGFDIEVTDLPIAN